MLNIETSTVAKETDGVWIKYQGSEILIASANSIKFQRTFAALSRPYARKIDKKTLDPKIQLEIMCETLSKSVILDWKNVVNNDGEQIEFDKRIANTVLLQNSEFRSFIIEAAADQGTFLDEFVDETVK